MVSLYPWYACVVYFCVSWSFSCVCVYWTIALHASYDFSPFLAYFRFVVGILIVSVHVLLVFFVSHCHFSELTGFSDTKEVCVVAVRAIVLCVHGLRIGSLLLRFILNNSALNWGFTIRNLVQAKEKKENERNGHFRVAWTLHVSEVVYMRENAMVDSICTRFYLWKRCRAALFYCVIHLQLFYCGYALSTVAKWWYLHAICHSRDCHGVYWTALSWRLSLEQILFWGCEDNFVGTATFPVTRLLHVCTFVTTETVFTAVGRLYQ